MKSVVRAANHVDHRLHSSLFPTAMRPVLHGLEATHKKHGCISDGNILGTLKWPEPLSKPVDYLATLPLQSPSRLRLFSLLAVVANLSWWKPEWKGKNLEMVRRLFGILIILTMRLVL